MTYKEQFKIEEYKALRQEHENNRKFIFERPLIIVLGMTAAFFGVKNGEGMEDFVQLIPSLFLAILAFNLWFTYNRMISSARIVTYIRLFHENKQNNYLIRWENRLHDFRVWTVSNRKKIKVFQREAKLTSSMEFYIQIFVFHVIVGIFFLIIVFLKCEALSNMMHGITGEKSLIPIIVNGTTLLFFVIILFIYNPLKTLKTLEVTCKIWIRVLKGVKEKL
jgi:hypothetical protein